MGQVCERGQAGGLEHSKDKKKKGTNSPGNILTVTPAGFLLVPVISRHSLCLPFVPNRAQSSITTVVHHRGWFFLYFLRFHEHTTGHYGVNTCEYPVLSDEAL